MTKLAGPLATVAIAALSGPVAVTAAGLAELVKLVQDRLDQTTEAKALRRKVTDSISAWAAGEGFDAHTVDLGLGLAAEVIARVGLDRAGLARNDNDPAKVTDSVVAAARGLYPDWPAEHVQREAHFGVAEKAIRATYAAPTSALREQNPTLPSIDDLRTRVLAKLDDVEKHDSLDEAADRASQSLRFSELNSPRWRYVVTTRPSAWHEVKPAQFDTDNARVVELRDLRLNGGCTALHRDMVCRRLGARRITHQADQAPPGPAVGAVVPLLLTFYCLLTMESKAELPVRRRDLYDQLVRLLIHGRWTPTAEKFTGDTEECLQILTAWACQRSRWCRCCRGWAPGRESARSCWSG